MTPNQRRVAELGGSIGAAATIAVIAARLAAPSSATAPIVPPPQVRATVASELIPRADAPRPQQLAPTRLVSCGDSRTARVAGDDRRGTIALGPGAGGACTLLFSRPWDAAPTCTVVGGTPHSLNTTDLVVTAAAPIVTYECKDRP